MEDTERVHYDDIKDNFIHYRKMVNNAIERYEQERLSADDSDKYKGLSESIKRKAAPFCRGYFTLAVVGKMSAGKSTFINALLNDNGLLPTGHFQTTCALTFIHHSDEKKLTVVYGDGHEEKFTENISEKLKELVAIPSKYKDLPINNVNRCILDDIPTKQIIGKELVDEMKKKSRKEVDIEQLKEYIEEFPKCKIPLTVKIESPLDEDYQGWQIVDTPGVDAIEGIEDETKQFLCGKGNPKVDAIMFVQSAQANIEDLHLNEFVKNTIDSITDDAKKRMFFILTHGSEHTFLDNKDKILDKAKKKFVDAGGIKERVIAVDSIASLLENDGSLDLESWLSSERVPPNWDAEEWKGCRFLLRSVDSMLHDDKKEINNENMRSKLGELANFSNLRSLLNNFVKESFEEIITLIEEDINCIDRKKKNISNLKNERNQIQQRQSNKEKERERHREVVMVETKVTPVGAPKIVGKIDLSSMNQSTRPKIDLNAPIEHIDLSSMNQGTRPKKKTKEERRKEREEKNGKQKRARIGQQRVDANQIMEKNKS